MKDTRAFLKLFDLLNVALRQALWNSEAELAFSLRKILINKQDTKEIWSKLQHYLPTFALFRSDRPSKDDDCEVQDPMKIAVKQALEEVATELERIKTKVQEKVRDTALRTLEKLKEMDDSLANQLNPLFREEPKWDRLFKLSLTGDDEIPVNKRGSGVRRLILLNFFRAEAEQRQLRDNTPNVIYAIEEPETSQHPSNQELLIAAFLELSQSESCQVLLTTHVPGLASLLPLEGLRYIRRDTENSIIIEFGSEEIYAKIADSLGVSPDAAISTAKALIMVEGYADVIFLRHASNAFKANGDLSVSLEEKQIIPIITGGCGNLKHWINLKLIEALGKPWGVFFDSDEGGLDPSTIEQKKQQITELQASGIPAFRTLKREAENYLHADVIFSETGKTVTFNDFDDVKVIVNDATSVRKIQVLERFWPCMNAEQIKERDRYLDDSGVERHELYEIVKTFLDMT